AEKKKSRTERSYDDILRQTTPKEGSLRHWLEQNIPDWRDSIGKVISEEILDERGLAPDHTQGSGLYGVRIDLEKLSSGCASLEELERGQESLFQQLSDCEAEVDKLKTNKKSTHNQLSIASTGLNKHESELALAESTVSGAASRLKAAKQIELEKIEERRSSIAEKIQAARDARKKLHAELQALRQRHAAQSTEDHFKIDARIEGAIEHLKNELSVGKDNGSKLPESHRSVIRELETQRDTAIADQGSDRSQLEAYLIEKSNFEKKMQEIPELERLHVAWTDFQKDKAPERIAAKDRVTFLSSELDRILAEVEHFSKEESAVKAFYEEKLAETEAKIDALRDLVSRAEAKLEQHGKHDHKAGECREPSEIAGLIFDLDKTYSRGKTISQEIATHIRVLRSTFRSADGAVRNAFTEWEAGKEGWKEDSRWLPIFEDWYEIYHHSLRVGIEDRVNRVGCMLRNSYNRIVRIDSDVDTISRKLRKSIANLTGFKRISDVDIS
ncbi:MAG: ATP-binding protein, partial [Parasphingorhabdus sp.]|uniref:ATP-binding protein n=1 Tax=Parasphingorhabdus sp. TaxID=2709688 RepID=UPI003296979D